MNLFAEIVDSCLILLSTAFDLRHTESFRILRRKTVVSLCMGFQRMQHIK